MPTTNDERMMLRRERLAATNIDADKRMIEGYVVIQRGELRDVRAMSVDDETMRQVVALGNGSDTGVKVRWTHPNYTDDHLGKYLGRAGNFRIDGDAVRADITFAKSAELSPVFERDPVAYILALAEEDPNAFATSIYFDRDAAAMVDLYELLEDDDQPVPIRIASLIASDIVDEGAAADTFFKSAAPGGAAQPDAKEIEMAEETKKQEEAAALARDEAKRETEARLARLRDAFEGEDAFVLEQFAKGHDVTEAKADWADVLTERLATKEKEHAEALKNASTPPAADADDGEPPIGNNGDGNDANARDAFEAKLDDYRRINVGTTRTEAMRAVIAKNPSLYRDAFGLHNIFQNESA